MDNSSPTNRGVKPPRTHNRHKETSRSLFPSFGEPISTASSLVRSNNNDGTITFSARDLSPDPRSAKQNSNGSPIPATKPTSESRGQRINTYIDIGLTKGLLLTTGEDDLISAPASLFLSNAYVYHSDTLRLSNIHSAINTPLIADALAEFALSQDTQEYSLSKFMRADHISQALIDNRPSITKTRNAGPGIPYSIHIRIDRREIGDLVPRLYSFVQHQVSTTTSTDLMRREMSSVESRMTAQLQQFQSLIISQQAATDVRLNSLMATMEAYIAESRTGNAAMAKEDV